MLAEAARDIAIRSHHPPTLPRQSRKCMGSDNEERDKRTMPARRGRWRRMILFFPLFLFASVPQQRDADKDTTAMLQANYLYNIAKLVEWRDPAMRSGNFIIGVIGSPNLYQELIRQYSTRTIGKQPIEVRNLPRTAHAEKCHMLFVGRSELALMPEIF